MLNAERNIGLDMATIRDSSQSKETINNSCHGYNITSCHGNERTLEEKKERLVNFISWIGKQENVLQQSLAKLRDNRQRLERNLNEVESDITAQRKVKKCIILVIGCFTPSSTNITLRNTG